MARHVPGLSDLLLEGVVLDRDRAEHGPRHGPHAGGACSALPRPLPVHCAFLPLRGGAQTQPLLAEIWHLGRLSGDRAESERSAT